MKKNLTTAYLSGKPTVDWDRFLSPPNNEDVVLAEDSVAKLTEDLSSSEYGGKASNLSKLARAGLPVPFGVALNARRYAEYMSRLSFFPYFDLVDVRLRTEFRGPRVYPIAVRSSAVGEDGLVASFAGRFDSFLNCYTWSEIDNAISYVLTSPRNRRVQEYMDKIGMTSLPIVGAIVQRMVIPSHSAVVFTRNPLDGTEEFLLDVTLGEGDKLVSGKVEPSSWSCARVTSTPEKVSGPDMEIPNLSQLLAFALRCEGVIDSPADVEAVYDGFTWWIVQARPITTK